MRFVLKNFVLLKAVNINIDKNKSNKYGMDFFWFNGNFHFVWDYNVYCQLDYR